MTTAEDVKRVLREYAADNHPGRRVTGVASFNVEGVDDLEQLVVTPDDPLLQPALVSP